MLTKMRRLNSNFVDLIIPIPKEQFDLSFHCIYTPIFTVDTVKVYAIPAAEKDSISGVVLLLNIKL